MQTSVHGVLVCIEGLGLLIDGPSGSGKSELALELLSRGHRLVADDVVDLEVTPDGALYGAGPEILRGYIEVRGLGIMDVRRMYGESFVQRVSRVDLCLALVAPDLLAAADRWTGLWTERELLGVKLPQFCLSARPGTQLSIMAEAGCKRWALQRDGHDAAIELARRQQQSMGERE